MRKPLPQDHYKDNRGLLVTVQSVEFNRVTFTREGYEHPCSYPLVRFVAEFTFAGRV